MLITALIIVFVVFLVYLSTGTKQIPQTSQAMPGKTGAETTAAPKEEIKPEPKPPQFDFYTILPEKRSGSPEYEIKTRTREEQVGKAKNTHYIMQADHLSHSKKPISSGQGLL